MLARLFLLMTVVPTIELYLLIRVGALMGPAATVAFVVGTGMLGAWLAKREGLGVIRQLKEESVLGIPPGDRVVEGLLVLVGSVLLISPGVLTDLLGLLIIIPPIRRWLAPRLKGWLLTKIVGLPGIQIGAMRPGPAAREEAEARAHRFDHPAL